MKKNIISHSSFVVLIKQLIGCVCFLLLSYLRFYSVWELVECEDISLRTIFNINFTMFALDSFLQDQVNDGSSVSWNILRIHIRYCPVC